MDGVVQCLVDGVSVLRSGPPDDGLVITISRVEPDVGRNREECLDVDGRVTKGQTIGGPGRYSVRATAGDGFPLSIAAPLDGHLTYTGDFRPAVGCPCRGGN